MLRNGHFISVTFHPLQAEVEARLEQQQLQHHAALKQQEATIALLTMDLEALNMSKGDKAATGDSLGNSGHPTGAHDVADDGCILLGGGGKQVGEGASNGLLTSACLPSQVTKRGNHPHLPVAASSPSPRRHHPSTWQDLPDSLLAAILCRAMGDPPVPAGTLSQMLVCKAWMQATLGGVASLQLPSGHGLPVSHLPPLPSLLSLHVEQNSLACLTDSVLCAIASSCPRLTCLHMGSQGTKQGLLPAEGVRALFQRCTALQELRFYCPLAEVPEDIGALTCLTSLHVDHKPGEQVRAEEGADPRVLPASMAHLRLLKEFSLASESARSLPQWFIEDPNPFTELDFLSLNMPLLHLPSFPQLSSLTSLALTANNPGPLSWVPDLLHLRELTLVIPCRHIQLPDTLSRLVQLTYFRQKGGHYHGCALPATFGLLPRLASCHVEWLTVPQLPQSFTHLAHLTTLVISRSYTFRSLPDSFGCLSALEDVTLTLQGIQHLPASFCQLARLASLTLSSCLELEDLPDQFGQLNSLVRLLLYA